MPLQGYPSLTRTLPGPSVETDPMTNLSPASRSPGCFIRPAPAACRVLRLAAIVLLAAGALAAGSDPAAAGNWQQRQQRTFPFLWRAPREVLDHVAVIVRERELLAVVGTGGSVLRTRLAAGETVIWRGEGGGVAMVMTDRRLFGVTARSQGWSESNFRVNEVIPEEGLLGGRVAAAASDERIFGIDAVRGILVEREIGPNELLLGARVGENVLVLATDRSVVGLSGFAGGFYTASLGVHEKVEALDAHGDFATVVTSRRLLVFRASDGTWQERELSLR
jgi:hypothetical protein